MQRHVATRGALAKLSIIVYIVLFVHGTDRRTPKFQAPSRCLVPSVQRSCFGCGGAVTLAVTPPQRTPTMSGRRTQSSPIRAHAVLSRRSATIQEENSRLPTTRSFWLGWLASGCLESVGQADINISLWRRRLCRFARQRARCGAGWYWSPAARLPAANSSLSVQGQLHRMIPGPGHCQGWIQLLAHDVGLGGTSRRSRRLVILGALRAARAGPMPPPFVIRLLMLMRHALFLYFAGCSLRNEAGDVMKPSSRCQPTAQARQTYEVTIS